jgi:hypothetical protein
MEKTHVNRWIGIAVYETCILGTGGNRFIRIDTLLSKYKGLETTANKFDGHFGRLLDLLFGNG